MPALAVLVAGVLSIICADATVNSIAQRVPVALTFPKNRMLLSLRLKVFVRLNPRLYLCCAPLASGRRRHCGHQRLLHVHTSVAVVFSCGSYVEQGSSAAYIAPPQASAWCIQSGFRAMEGM